MYQFTNDQRRCFGLDSVEPHWTMIKLSTSRYDHHDAYAYLDGTVIKKGVFVADDQYFEYDYDERLTDDLVFLRPKTNRGKPVRLSSASLLKRSSKGMVFQCFNHNGEAHIDIWCADNQLGYYSNTFETILMETFDDFTAWVDRWCVETTEDDIREIEEIKRKKRVHIKYQEGDVFRFKLTRRLYGYARILRDYNRLEKEGIPYIRLHLGTVMLCSAFFIITEEKNIPMEELKKRKSMPSLIYNDSVVYYGEYEIVGNIPLTDDEDYPYVYERSKDFAEEQRKIIYFQNGKELLMIENDDEIPHSHRTSVGLFSWMKLDILRRCIEEDSTEPFWNDSKAFVLGDLRHPKNQELLLAIRRQFGLE